MAGPEHHSPSSRIFLKFIFPGTIFFLVYFHEKYIDSFNNEQRVPANMESSVLVTSAGPPAGYLGGSVEAVTSEPPRRLV